MTTDTPPKGRKRRIHVYPGDAVHRLLKETRPGNGGRNRDPASMSGRINNVVDRYLALIEDGVPVLSLAEWCMLCDALKSSGPAIGMIDPMLIRLLVTEIVDAEEHEGLATKWRVDLPALARKLEGIGQGGRTAAVEVVERWWKTEHSPGTTYRDSLLAAGARIGEAP